MAYYDIGEVFQLIEEEMIASMSRNLKRHISTEHAEGLNYSMWQAEQLAALNNYRKDNRKKFSKYFSTINSQIDDLLREAKATGKMDQEIRILEAIKNGFKVYDRSAGNTLRGNFFRINERKLNALIAATKKDMARAETAMLRRADDEYRKILFNAEAYYNTGTATLPQAVDMATKDFLSRGITCIEYANGAMVGIDVYSRMAIRTAATRAYLQGESEKRDEWGINTVIVNKRGAACPRCMRYTGKVFYDDVWGHSPVPSPAKYPRLSTAISGGLYHPNCKDIHTTYFEGISTPPEPMTQDEIDEANRVYALEQRQRYNERQIRKYKRLQAGSVDPENTQKYGEKLKYWQAEQKKHIAANSDVLRSRPELEKVFQMPDDFVAGYGGSADAVSSLQKVLAKSEKAIYNASVDDVDSLSLRFLSNRDNTYKNLQEVPPLDGYEDIACHADSRSFAFVDPNDEETVQQVGASFLANRVRESGKYNGGNIRLIACESGKETDGLAQQFADKMGVKVLAPTKIVYTNSQGFMVLADDDLEAIEIMRKAKEKWNPEGWVEFEPKG